MRLTIDQVIGLNVKMFRKLSDMTQVELARRVKVTQGFVSLLEKGKRQWVAQEIEAFAKALRTTPEMLIARRVWVYERSIR